MELQAIVEPFADQRLDALDVVRREVRAHLDDDATVLQVEVERVLGIGRIGHAAGDGRCGERGTDNQSANFHVCQPFFV